MFCLSHCPLDVDNRLGGHRSVGESHIRPVEVDIQDTATSSDGGGHYHLVRDSETQAPVEVFAMHVHDGRAEMSGRHEVDQSRPEICPCQSTNATREARSFPMSTKVALCPDNCDINSGLRSVPLMRLPPGDTEWLEARAERLPPHMRQCAPVGKCCATSESTFAECGSSGNPGGDPLKWQGGRKDSEWSSGHGRQRSWFGEVAYVNIILDACRQEPQAERPWPLVAAMLWEFLDETNLWVALLSAFGLGHHMCSCLIIEQLVT